MDVQPADPASDPGGRARAQPASRTSERRQVAGIYGTIITAAVLAAGAKLETSALAVGVLITLIVYWAAEQYAEVLGGQIEHGRLPSWRSIRAGLVSTWPMVSAAYLPVLALVLARLLGASKPTAANIALAVAVLLLLIHGWAAGRAAQLRGRQLLIATSIAGGLGVTMIILKNFVVTNLH